MYKRLFEYTLYLRDKLRSRNPELYKSLKAQTNNGVDSVKSRTQVFLSMMTSHGIASLPSDENEREELLKKYPDLHKFYHDLYNNAEEISGIMINNPWLWTPGEDVGYYYDINGVQEHITNIVNSEEAYMADLQNQMDKVDAKIQASSVENQDLINQKNFLMDLNDDVIATIGDRILDMWWNSIPRIIKEKYAKFMDGLMICALASDDVVVGLVKAYDILPGDAKTCACATLITMLVEDLNNTFFKEHPITLEVYSNPKDDHSGVNKGDIVKFNVDKIGKNVDELVGTIKHEIFGHYIDRFYPDFSLVGGTMQKFVNENLVNVCGSVFCHGHLQTEYGLVAISPLLKQQYALNLSNNLNAKKLKKLGTRLEKSGWAVAILRGKEFWESYLNIMTERSAWLIDKQTKDVVRKIDEFRAKNGLPYINSMSISIER